MAKPGDTTFAQRFLQRRPDIRQKALSSQDFAAWRSRFKRVVIDGVPYAVVGGDMLKDEDELILDWARQSGLVSQDDVDREHRDEGR